METLASGSLRHAVMLLPQDTFTYISDAHNTTSWIDHFVSSFSVHQAMLNMDVLTEWIISDHRAVAVSIQCSHLPEFDDEVMEPQPSRIDWLKVTDQEREDYYHKSKSLLDQLQVPIEVRHCQNFNCTDGKHLCSRHIFNGLYMFNVDTIKGNSVKGITQQRQEKPAQRL